MEGRARLRQAAVLERRRRRARASSRDTIFFERSVQLFAFDFGASDSGRDIGYEIRQRIGPSLALAVPTFLLGLFVVIVFSLLLVFFRSTYLEFWGVMLAVFLMSISALFYIIVGQFFFSKLLEAGADLRLRRRRRPLRVPGAAGGHRHRVASGRRGALLPDDVSRGDRQGLRAHGARRRASPRPRCCSGTCCATRCCRS